MEQRGGIGCGTMFGAAILGSAGLSMLAIGMSVQGSTGAVVFCVALALPGLLGAAQLVRGDLRRSAERHRAALATIERRILAIASAHQGRVSPAMVTMSVPGVDVAAAKRQLDAMARNGYCTVDSDDDGRPYYTFPIGVRPANEPSPEEWVKQVSGADPRARMTGEDSASQSTHTEA